MSTVDSRLSQSPAAGIGQIVVEDLFGLHSYRIAPPSTIDPDLSRVLILYGDNGTGKTTILEALFHILSPHPRASHRSRIGQIPFRLFQVEFRNGRSVWARRSGDSLTGEYELGIRDIHGDISSVTWRPRPNEDDGAESDRLWQLTRAEVDIFVHHLAEVFPEKIYYLRDDRRMQSDALPNLEEDDDESRLLRAVAASGVRRRGTQRKDPRTEALELSITRVNEWVSRQLIGASNVGGENTNAIYLDVIRRIASPSTAVDPGATTSITELQVRIDQLGQRAEAFSRLGLAPATPTRDLIGALESVPESRSEVARSVLVPFVDALTARFDALDDLRDSLETFLDQANSFFHASKRVTYSLKDGLRIRTDSGAVLPPSTLSSGERQLLLLLTAALYARDTPTLYIIDEPELSLNMKWQRRLIDSLVACSHGADMSFVMASHSFELMAAARERVQELVAT